MCCWIFHFEKKSVYSSITLITQFTNDFFMLTSCCTVHIYSMSMSKFKFFNVLEFYSGSKKRKEFCKHIGDPKVSIRQNEPLIDSHKYAALRGNEALSLICQYKIWTGCVKASRCLFVSFIKTLRICNGMESCLSLLVSTCFKLLTAFKEFWTEFLLPAFFLSFPALFNSFTPFSPFWCTESHFHITCVFLPLCLSFPTP